MSNCLYILQTASSSFPIVFRAPNNCEREQCTFYWAMGPNTANPQYLDVYMEGNATGWMAVGFSDDQMMVNSNCFIPNIVFIDITTMENNHYEHIVYLILLFHRLILMYLVVVSTLTIQ